MGDALCASDKRLNDQTVRDGSRIFSAYGKKRARHMAGLFHQRNLSSLMDWCVETCPLTRIPSHPCRRSNRSAAHAAKCGKTMATAWLKPSRRKQCQALSQIKVTSLPRQRFVSA